MTPPDNQHPFNPNPLHENDLSFDDSGEFDDDHDSYGTSMTTDCSRYNQAAAELLRYQYPTTDESFGQTGGGFQPPTGLPISYFGPDSMDQRYFPDEAYAPVESCPTTEKSPSAEPLTRSCFLAQDRLYNNDNLLCDEDENHGVCEAESAKLLQCLWNKGALCQLFPDQNALMEHIQTEHIDTQSHAAREVHGGKWNCNWKKCISRISEKKSLVRHVKSLHVYPRGNHCDLCEMRFNRKDNLTDHKKAVHE